MRLNRDVSKNLLMEILVDYIEKKDDNTLRKNGFEEYLPQASVKKLYYQYIHKRVIEIIFFLFKYVKYKII